MAEWQQEGRPAHPLFEQAWPEGDYRFFQLGFVVSTFQPNPNLVPESSVGWDAGWEQTFWNGRVLFDVTYFNSRLQNEIRSAWSKTR